jgi:hypothetical protein
VDLGDLDVHFRTYLSRTVAVVPSDLLREERVEVKLADADHLALGSY